jgi:hypothetical protein
MTTITVDILRETADGILVFDGDCRLWLPKSKVEYEADVPAEAVEIRIPVWLAEKEGLV